MTPRQQAISLYNQGVAIAATDQPMAYRMLSSAVVVDPTFHDGWYAVGNANADMGARPGAIAAHRRAVELNRQDAKAWTNLGHQLYMVGQLKEARFATERALKIDPKAAFAWCNLSLIESVEGELSASLDSAQKAFSLDQSPTVEVALAFALLFDKQWALGLKHYEARFAYKIEALTKFPYPQWQGEELTKFPNVESAATLFLTTDMGIGDTLSYLRFVPAAASRVSKVVLQVQPELMRLAVSMLRHLPNVSVGPLGQTFPDADYWCALTSLPVALHLTDDEIESAPNLKIPYAQLGATTPWKIPGRRFHVGIAWAGAPENGIDHWRSMKVEPFLDLYKVPGIQLYSLQVGPHAEDLHTAGCVSLIKDMAPFVRDVADTGAVMRDLDLVITVESAVGHIAGCHNVDCWVLYSYNGRDYRMGHDEQGPLWYKRTRIFKQGPDAQWQPVMDRIVEALQERVHG